AAKGGGCGLHSERWQSRRRLPATLQASPQRVVDDRLEAVAPPPDLLLKVASHIVVESQRRAHGDIMMSASDDVKMSQPALRRDPGPRRPRQRFLQGEDVGDQRAAAA